MNVKYKVLFMVVVMSIVVFVSGCQGESLGEYWEFGKAGSGTNRIYLASEFSCVVEDAGNNEFKATCVNKENGEEESMFVEYYKHGDDYWLY